MSYLIGVVVEGIGRGLLMHKFSAEASADLEREVKKAKRAFAGPAAEAELSAYRLTPTSGQEKGQLCLPAEHFLGGIVKAGSGLQIKGRGKKTYKGAFLGAIDIQPDYIGLTNGTGWPLFDYEIDSRPVRNPSTRGRVIRHRPHLVPGWRASFTILLTFA